MEFAYVGFTHRGSLRSFAFEGRKGDAKQIQRFTVIADMSVFLRHHVEIQRGPQIAGQVLSRTLLALASPESALPDPLTISEDLLIELGTAKIEAAASKNAHRKYRPKRAPTSQFHFSPSNSQRT